MTLETDSMAARDDTTEIRVEVPADLCAVFDGLARGRRMTRNQLFLKVMHEYADAECRALSVLSEAAARNPLVAEKIGKVRA